MPLLDIILGYDCNLACDYCTITPAMRERALPTRAIADAMKRQRAAGYDRVSFTGGEPTIRSDLLGLVRYANKLGFANIKVQSNGLVYATADNVQRLSEAGCNNFHISIHTHDRDAYDTMVRRAGAHQLMVDGLRNAIAADVPLQVDAIITTTTLPRLVDAARWLHAEGVRALNLWFVSLTDNNRDNLASMPRMTDALPTMAEVFAYGRSHDMTIRSLHVPRCLLGDDAAHAFDPGADDVCVVTPEATFQLHQSKLAGQGHVPACVGCEHEAICPGIRDDYLERYGDEEIAAARGVTPSRAPSRTLATV